MLAEGPRARRMLSIWPPVHDVAPRNVHDVHLGRFEWKPRERRASGRRTGRSVRRVLPCSDVLSLTTLSGGQVAEWPRSVS